MTFADFRFHHSLTPKSLGRKACVLLLCLGWSCAVVGQEGSWGVILGESINLRKKTGSTSAVIGKIHADLELVRIVGESHWELIKTVDPNREYPWVEIESPSAGHGHIFGFYIEKFDSREEARVFIRKNQELRKKLQGSWRYHPSTTEVFSPNDSVRLTFAEDGTLKMTLCLIEGDHILNEEGAGRLYLSSDFGTVRVVANLTGTTSPDGRTWEEYFQLGHDRLPEKEELEAFIKEREHYETRCEFTEPASLTAEVFVKE